MFFYSAMWGDRLPDKVLCLTFDDGPDDCGGGGPQTLNLARFLHEHGVPATFFVLGERAKESLDTLVALRNMGHLIGNHTDCHPDLVKSTAAGVNPVSHVLGTDLIIRNALFSKEVYLSETTFFRPPYGRWRDPQGDFSRVTDPLNRESMLSRCIGPINWDIDSRDWACWRDGISAASSAEQCLARIQKKGKGIVLLHDSNFEEKIRHENNTYAVCKIIIPELQKRGYRFIRLDAVPQVTSATLVSRRFSLKTFDGKHFISINQHANGNVLAFKINFGEQGEFGLVERENGQIAIRVFNGEYLSVRDVEKGSYSYSFTPRIGASELFYLIRLADNKVSFKIGDGEHFLSASPRGFEVTSSIGESETFVLNIL